MQANISAMSQYSPAIRRWYHLLHQQSTRMHPHEVAEGDSKKTPARVVVLLMITAFKNFGTHNSIQLHIKNVSSSKNLSTILFIHFLLWLKPYMPSSKQTKKNNEKKIPPGHNWFLLPSPDCMSWL